LRDWGINPEVPDRCGDQILSRLKVRAEVETFVAPVGQIATGRAITDSMTVHKENEAVVGGYANQIVSGNSG
jgi:hypothetical protein